MTTPVRLGQLRRVLRLVVTAALIGGAIYTWWPATAGAAGSPQLRGAPDGLTNSNSVSISWEAGDGFGIQRFICALDRTPWVACDIQVDFSGLPDGRHMFQLQQFDAYGDQVGDTAQADWEVDATSPAPPELSGAPDSPSRSAEATFSYSGEAGARFSCSLDGAPFEQCQPSPVFLNGLSDGGHNFSVIQTDQAGNDSDPATATWTVDTTAPAAPQLSGTPDSPTRSTQAAFSFSGEDGATFICSVDGAPFEQCQPSPVFLNGLSDGEHSFSVKQAVQSSAYSEPATSRWTVDTSPPAAPSITTKPSGTTTSTSATIGFSGSGEPGATFECKTDTADWGSCPSNPFTLDSLALGSHTVQIRETDAAGNTGGAATVNWTIQSVTTPSCTSLPTPPTPTTTVRLTRLRGGRWVMNAGSVFSTGGETSGCAQILTIQVSTELAKPSNSATPPSVASFANGVLAWNGSAVSRNGKQPRWMRVGNRIGRWSGWVQIKR